MAHVSRTRSVSWMPSFLIQMPFVYRRVTMFSHANLSHQSVERLEQKTWAQQICDFLQKAGDWLGFGNAAINGSDSTRWKPIVAGYKCDGNIGFSGPHVPRGRFTVHIRHVVIEKHQVNRIRHESLHRFRAICGG